MRSTATIHGVSQALACVIDGELEHKAGEGDGMAAALELALAKGAAKLSVKNSWPGCHAFSVLGTESKGNTRTSRPVPVIVRAVRII